MLAKTVLISALAATAVALPFGRIGAIVTGQDVSSVKTRQYVSHPCLCSLEIAVY
jgi:hypothetical protein